MKQLLFIAVGVMSFILIFTREYVPTKLDWYVHNGKLCQRVVRCDGGGKA